MSTTGNISAGDYLTNAGQWQGPINPQKILESAGKLAGETRQVTGDPMQSVYPLSKEVGRGSWWSRDPVAKDAARGVMKDAKAQHEALGRAAGKAGDAAEVEGAARAVMEQRLSDVQIRQSTFFQSAMEAYDSTLVSPDEYMQEVNTRINEHLENLDSINEKMWRDRDFSQAHAMQAGAQAVLGSMKVEERGILQQYGANSKEYEQFFQGKKVALAVMQSNIFNNYQQLSEQQHQNYLNTYNEAYVSLDMHRSFERQKVWDMHMWAADSKAMYSMQQAQFDIGVEQLRMNNMSEWAQYIEDAPTFTFDATPYIGMLLGINNMSDPSIMQQLGTAAMGGLSGGLTGGIGAGVGNFVGGSLGVGTPSWQNPSTPGVVQSKASTPQQGRSTA